MTPQSTNYRAFCVVSSWYENIHIAIDPLADEGYLWNFNSSGYLNWISHQSLQWLTHGQMIFAERRRFQVIDMVQKFCKECLVLPLFISRNNKQKNNWLPCGKRNHQRYHFNTVTSYLPHVPPLQLALSGVFANIVFRFNGAKTIADLPILIFRCPTDDH